MTDAFQFSPSTATTGGDATTADGPALTLHQKHQEWLNRRGIESDTAIASGLSTKRDDRGHWLVFPYRLGGRIVNRKYRLTSDKQHQMDKGGKLCLWNADCLRSEAVMNHGATVIITEGEFDALIAMQCGFDSVVSVPNGAPAERMDDPANSKRYAFLWESLDDLERVKSFVLATDGDGPGRVLAHDLAAILGAERCRFLEYPDGCKDLNDVFLKSGAPGVNRLIDAAKPYPVRGLYSMSDFPDVPPVQGMQTGIIGMEDKIEIVPGTLTVFTGYANMGKSTIVNTIIGRCIASAVPVCIASFETMPKPILRDGLAKALIGCSSHEFETHNQRGMAYETIENNVSIISNALDDDLSLDLTAFLELARVSVIRDGAKVVILDPWNELEHKRRGDETGTEYVGRCIREVKAFARRYNVAFWIVAHPTKPQKGVNGPPTLYDVSDSANWANKADYGLVYHRKDRTVNEGSLSVVKVRMGLPGEICAVSVKFDHRKSRIAAFTS